MDGLTHDPSGFIRQFQQLLISDKKKIAFLFGAGTSMAKKNEHSLSLQGINELTKVIENELNKNPKIENAISEIELEVGEKRYNLEELLSNLEQKQQVIGRGTLNGLDKIEIGELIENIKNLIREKVSIHIQIDNDRNHLDNIIHCDFAQYINNADRMYGIEVFTLNYDYLFELALESKNIPYYDGFTGSYNPFFDSGIRRRF